MKKTFFILGLLLSFSFLFAQNFQHSKPASILHTPAVEEEYFSPTADCAAPKGVTNKYAPNCEHITLTWADPTEILFDSTFPADDEGFYHGYPSCRWMMDEPESYFNQADDFEVPEGEIWQVSEVYIYGFVMAEDIAPDFIGIAIYFDSGSDVPGDVFYENEYLSPSGSISGKKTIVLSETLTLLPGTYWISFYGTYEKEYIPERRYSAVFSEDVIWGSPVAIQDGVAGDWEPYFQTCGSLYFRIIGSKSSEEFTYNIYLNNEFIGTTDEKTFTYSDFDYTKQHQFGVAIACPAGGESTRVNTIARPCVPQSVNDLQPSFSIVPNPATTKITITTENSFNKIEVINFLGQSVISQTETTIDVSQLPNGVYFVRLNSDNGISVQKFVKQ